MNVQIAPHRFAFGTQAQKAGRILCLDRNIGWYVEFTDYPGASHEAESGNCLARPFRQIFEGGAKSAKLGKNRFAPRNKWVAIGIENDGTVIRDTVAFKGELYPRKRSIIPTRRGDDCAHTVQHAEKLALAICNMRGRLTVSLPRRWRDGLARRAFRFGLKNSVVKIKEYEGVHLNRFDKTQTAAIVVTFLLRASSRAARP